MSCFRIVVHYIRREGLLPGTGIKGHSSGALLQAHFEILNVPPCEAALFQVTFKVANVECKNFCII